MWSRWLGFLKDPRRTKRTRVLAVVLSALGPGLLLAAAPSLVTASKVGCPRGQPLQMPGGSPAGRLVPCFGDAPLCPGRPVFSLEACA